MQLSIEIKLIDHHQMKERNCNAKSRKSNSLIDAEINWYVSVVNSQSRGQQCSLVQEILKLSAQKLLDDLLDLLES